MPMLPYGIVLPCLSYYLTPANPLPQELTAVSEQDVQWRTGMGFTAKFSDTKGEHKYN